jgi:hypothetical protein
VTIVTAPSRGDDHHRGPGQNKPEQDRTGHNWPQRPKSLGSAWKGETDTDFFLGTSVGAGLALGVAPSLLVHSSATHSVPLFSSLGILVRIAESNHFHAAVTL